MGGGTQAPGCGRSGHDWRVCVLGYWRRLLLLCLQARPCPGPGLGRRRRRGTTEWDSSASAALGLRAVVASNQLLVYFKVGCFYYIFHKTTPFYVLF